MKNWILCLVSCVLAGCGGGGVPEPTVEEHVYAHVVGLGDASGSEKMFQSAFVTGAVPQNRKDYGKYVYVIDGTAEIDGDEATVPVKIIAGMVVSPKGAQGKTAEQTETKMTWKLKREGEEWKIKEAPLPG
ncbi:hypothetical protein [Gimesia fumaroli]|uniref:DUF4878 domain-containing protein n=1 Tax=Gimesia fumaroli TaxID=2527976 RepID=A0A518I9G0_9PLAN|nr:hypothetical protein [Gimesia fumaroli]QDV49632.1 hypothetical protein Enr17x_16530 [Gimesia fumaroli]